MAQRLRATRSVSFNEAATSHRCIGLTVSGNIVVGPRLFCRRRHLHDVHARPFSISSGVAFDDSPGGNVAGEHPVERHAESIDPALGIDALQKHDTVALIGLELVFSDRAHKR